jgi:ABC-type antimicrobial peptide transport system permease subunit
MEPKSAVKTVENAVWAVDSQQPVTLVRTMDELIEADVADRTRPMILLGVFAGLALVLACIGVYGVLAYAVAQRTREIGVRMALGAQRGAIYRLVLREAGWLTMAGIAAGVISAIGAATLMRGLLFGVTSWDVPTLVSVSTVLGVSALAASYLPGRRAASVNPVEALRAE